MWSRIARNVESEITNFIYDKIRQADHAFSKYEFKYIRFSANTTTSFIQFERTVDHLEFIKLLDRCEFNGIKLKVMPFGFTNSVYQEFGKAMMWQDSACKLFNSQWYPTDTVQSEAKQYVRSQN